MTKCEGFSIRSFAASSKYVDGSVRMDNSKTKQIALAGGGIAGSFAMILLAMALAQRDARDERSIPNLEFAYAHKPAQGIVLATTVDENGFPPLPVIRGNDSAPVSTKAAIAVDKNNAFRSPGSFVQYTREKRNGALAEPPPFRDAMPLPSSNSTLLPSMPLPVTTSRSSLPTTQPTNELRSSELPARLPAEPPTTSLGAVSNSLPTMVPSSIPSGRMTDAPSLPEDSTLPENIVPTSGLPSSPLSTGSSNLPSSPFSQPRATPLPSNELLPELDNGESNTATARLQRPATITDRSVEPRILESENRSLPASRLPNDGFEPAPMPSLTTTTSPIAIPIRNSADEARVGTVGMQESRPAPPTNPTGQFSPLASPAPGIRNLDGSQNPSMEIQKRAPAEVQVGIPSTFTLLVRNVGNATAFDVSVHDAVPQGAKLVRTNPTAQTDPNGKLLWKLGEMKAGSEQVLTIDLIPETEGELGSVASVNFAAQASVRTMSTQPKLVVNQKANTSVLGGDNLRITIEVSNTGTGTARGVELEEDVPSNMRHSSGVSTLGLTIGDLAPGESERFDIDLVAVNAGKAVNKIRAVSTNSAPFESSATIDVVLPKLVLNMEGPRLRYLERQATYRASITNAGTAIARNVELMLYLPRGMEFNSAANEGTYMPEQHAVAWSLSELSAGSSAITEVVLLPVQEGDFVLRIQGLADGVRADAIDKKVQVEGQSELAFTIEDDNDPIETDGLTTYFVRITNTGTRMDNDVQLVIEMPEGSKSEQVNAPTNHQVSQRTIVFSPIPQMQPKDQQVYRVAVRHSREGVLVLRAQLKSKNRPVPIVKEESTQVYRDR